MDYPLRCVLLAMVGNIMINRKRWSEQHDEQLKRLLGTMMAEEIAEIMGRTCVSVRTRAQRFGISWAFKRKTPKWTNEHKRRLEEMIKSGMTIKQAANELGFAYASVRTFASREGIHRFKSS